MAEPPRRKSAQPGPPRRFAPGPALQPVAELRAWLDRQGEPRPRPRLRLPVAMRFAAGHRMAIDTARVAGAPGDDGLAVVLDDSALGIALIDHVRRHTPAGAGGCALWLEGYWGALLALPTAGHPPGQAPPVFAVVAVGEPVDPGAGPLHALIEVPPLPDR